MAQLFLRNHTPRPVEHRLSRPARLVIGGTAFVAAMGLTVLFAVVFAVWSIDDTAVDAEIVRATAAYAAAGSDAPANTYATNFVLADARFVTDGVLHSGEASIPAGDGRLLAWTPRRLGSEVFMTLAPLRLASCAAVLAAIGFVLRRFYLLALELEAKRKEARELADRDVLTGVSNRLAFDDTLRTSLAAGQALSLLYIDLDDFKRVNDTFGHGAGDTLLRIVAKRLATIRREGDLVARLGGDEFAMLVRSTAGRQALGELAQDIRYALAAPILIEGTTLHVGASIGIAEAPTDANIAEKLVAAADRALYRAKSGGQERFAFAADAPAPVTTLMTKRAFAA